MLPDTELLCELRDGLTLCDAGQWHFVFLVQTVLVCSLGLLNVGLGLRHVTGRLQAPVWVARRFAWATLLASAVPLASGLWLREQIRAASHACYLTHTDTGCVHSLVDRGREMAGLFHWVGWTEGALLGTCLVALGLLYTGNPRR
jgi:hypothetical protein